MGRPTEYKDSYDEQAFKLCLLGATDKEIADFFEVSETTVNNWKLQHPSFLESLKNGKTIADAEIANSLYNRAKGVIVKHQQAFKMKETFYEEGKKSSESETIEIVDLEQELPPDTTAAIFWLKNRAKATWREKQEAIEVEDDSEITINVVRVSKNKE